MTEQASGSTWAAWTESLQNHLAGSAVDRAKQRCPRCGNAALRLLYAVREGSDVGYLMFWCDSCLTGIYGSRASIPAGADTIPMGLPPEERSRFVPDYRIIPPDDDQDDDPDVESAVF